MNFSMLDSISQDEEIRLRKIDERLLKRAKLFNELIVEIRGKVLSVRGYSQSMEHTPLSEMVIGGKSPIYETGYQNSLEISLRRSDIGSPIKILFRGNSPLVAGNILIAGVFIGEKRELHLQHKNKRIYTGIERDRSAFARDYQYALVPRALKKKEEALYLKIIREASNIRTDFCVDYDFEKFPKSP